MVRLFFSLFAVYFIGSAFANAQSENALSNFKECTGEDFKMAKVVTINQFGDITLSNGDTLTMADTHFITQKADEFLPAKTHTFLQKLLAGQSITYIVTQKPDRYKRLPSQIWLARDNGLRSLQEELYKQRLGVFMPDPLQSSTNQGDCKFSKNTLLYRSAPNIKYFSADNPSLWNQEGEFVIITGVVKSIYKGKSATNWNFGDNWRDDFSISIPNAIKLYKEHDKDLSGKIIGKSVRIRGYLDLANGPFIRIDHPAQIELKN